MEKIKVLVVDDKKIIGDLFDFTLGYTGKFDITVVDSAQKAIEMVQLKRFDIAFIDIVMPHQDGVSTLQEIKKLVPQLPVVMMSGYSVEDKRTKAKELGAVTCLKKPFEMEDVRLVIEEVLGKKI